MGINAPVVLCLLFVLTKANLGVSIEEQHNNEGNTITRLESLVTRLGERLDVIEDRLNRISHKSMSEVVFSAYLDTSADYAEGKTIVFPAYWANLGDVYDSTTGIFTCPLAGLYHFSLTVHVREDDFELELVRDGMPIAAAAANYYEYDQGSIAVIIPCNAGDQVWSRNGGSGTATFGELTKDGSCIANAFTGFLLYQF